MHHVYFNAQFDKMFTRNNCQSNETGGTYIYIVPNGKYIFNNQSGRCQSKAEDDIDQNGKMQLIKMHHVELMDFIM